MPTPDPSTRLVSPHFTLGELTLSQVAIRRGLDNTPTPPVLRSLGRLAQALERVRQSLGDVPILGVPGAAISMPTTIFDVLLPQIYAGDRLTHEDLIRLGDGGLCRLCKPCHFPNCTFGRY